MTTALRFALIVVDLQNLIAIISDPMPGEGGVIPLLGLEGTTVYSLKSAIARTESPSH